MEKQTQLGKALLSVFVLVDLESNDRGESFMFFSLCLDRDEDVENQTQLGKVLLSVFVLMESNDRDESFIFFFSLCLDRDGVMEKQTQIGNHFLLQSLSVVDAIFLSHPVVI